MAIRTHWERAIVVGASSGIGEAIARQLASEDVRVAVLARRAAELARVVASDPERLVAYAHDVEDTGSVPELYSRIARELGGVDLLVYAAGVMHPIDEDEYDFEKDAQMVRINLLGAMAWMNVAAAHFEAARAGTLVGISSIAGERGRRTNPAYCTSKAAFTTYLEALRNRVSRAGVNVVTIKPGFVDTAMVRGREGLFWLISPERAAEASLRLARKGTSASGFVPSRWWLVAFVLHHLPSFLFRRLNF